MTLVARRELFERARQRSFQVSTLVILLLVAGGAALGGVLHNRGPDEFKVGARSAHALQIARAARQAAPGLDARIKLRREASERAGRTAVDDGDLDIFVTAPGALLSKDSPDDKLEQLLQSAARQVRGLEVLRGEGVSPARARRALNPPALRVRRLEGGEADRRRGVAIAASFLLYGLLIVYGLWVAMGVVEEKASRVVEVLLATVEPRWLLTGKVIGLGLLGLGQLLLAALIGLGTAVATGVVDLDGTTIGMVGVALVWFLLGYALYAWLYAASAVLVSRQEDLQSITTPLTLLLVAAFFVVFPTIDKPDSTLAKVTSLVPFSSPLAMPARVAQGEASGVEIALSLFLLVLSVAVLVPIGVRVYESAILRTGRPLKLADAWRAVRS